MKIMGLSVLKASGYAGASNQQPREFPMSQTTPYYTLGRTGLRVSRLSLGAMTFGTEWGWGSDKASAQRIFDTYLAHGGNFVDTADVYTNGTSEAWVGDFIRDAKARDQVVLATKYTFNLGDRNANGGGNGRHGIQSGRLTHASRACLSSSIKRSAMREGGRCAAR